MRLNGGWLYGEDETTAVALHDTGDATGERGFGAALHLIGEGGRLQTACHADPMLRLGQEKWHCTANRGVMRLGGAGARRRTLGCGLAV